MPTIRLPEESEHGDMVKKIDAMIREISKATTMTPSTRALGLRPSILIGNHQELAHVMATRTLLNLQKRMIALAVAAAKSAPYELYAHTRGLQREYGLDDGQIVELIAVIAHVISINTFENAIAAFNDAAPIRSQDPSLPVLVEVRAKLGSVPRYFQYMAGDPAYAKIILDREVSTVHEGEVSRLNKELVAYATSVADLRGDHGRERLREELRLLDRPAAGSDPRVGERDARSGDDAAPRGARHGLRAGGQRDHRPHRRRGRRRQRVVAQAGLHAPLRRRHPWCDPGHARRHPRSRSRDPGVETRRCRSQHPHGVGQPPRPASRRAGHDGRGLPLRERGRAPARPGQRLHARRARR